MDIRIMLGGISFLIDSEFELKIENSWSSFLWTEEAFCDITIKVRREEKRISKPQVCMRGEDLLLEYYKEKEQLICLAKGGVDGYLAQTLCDGSLTKIECNICSKHMESLGTLGNILRLIPMGIIFQEKKVLFFHASQIEIKGKGILFTAPSGTGKTTQAKLWKKYRNAKIICNDRTLLRGGQTYGYPIDGSEPVRSGKILPSGAIVVLAQGEENSIRRLAEKEALKLVMPQLVTALWDPMTRFLAMEQIVALMEKCPIYYFSCVPEESAVQCLEQQLIIDGVI